MIEKKDSFDLLYFCRIAEVKAWRLGKFKVTHMKRRKAMMVVHVLVMTMLIMLSTSFVRSFSIGTMRRRMWSLKQLQGNPNVDLFGADSVSLKLDGIDKNRTSQVTEAAMTEYMKEAEEKASTSIVSSITGNRTMKAEALRLEAELDQIKFNEAKMNKKKERLAQFDR